LALTDLDVESKLYLAIFEGSSSGLVDSGDIEEAGRILDPGTSAAILVVRERVGGAARRRAAPQRRSARRSGRIPVQALLAALDAADAADAVASAADGSAARGSTPNGSSRR